MQGYDRLQIDMVKNHNETWEQRCHKYTLNLPIDLFEKAKRKAREAGIYRVSIYFRAIIEREVSGTTALTMDHIIPARKESNRVASAEHRRERLNEISTSRRGLKKFLRYFQPSQYKFEFKK